MRDDARNAWLGHARKKIEGYFLCGWLAREISRLFLVKQYGNQYFSLSLSAAANTNFLKFPWDKQSIGEVWRKIYEQLFF